MKIPIRPAPAPPPSNRSQTISRNSTPFGWDDCNNDAFFKQNITRSSAPTNQPPGVKKKPPPRPPPPKISEKFQQKQGPSRPSDLLSGLFSRRQSSRSRPLSYVAPSGQRDSSIPMSSLIDLDSPSSSPTPTTRSSSDGLSINSFGSDGSNSNNTPGNGSSLFESGFEDDFDFFGGLSSTNIKPAQVVDPWSAGGQDPFSPPPTTLSAPKPAFMALPEEISTTQAINKPVSNKPTMPTIIRPKPPRPALPKLNGNRMIAKNNIVHSQPIPSVQIAASQLGFDSPDNLGFSDDGWSPPMPSIPPPPLPPDALKELDDILPDLPPRPPPRQMNLTKPHGIALYDYAATHADDLSFKTNDVIFLVREVNSDWLQGKCDGREGIFPSNFIRVVVSIGAAGERSGASGPSALPVKALYSFAAESWDDLQFQEGATINILGRVNADWLYGECAGKKGQFPAAFVSNVPPDLPTYKV